jgi:hypothetical protein
MTSYKSCSKKDRTFAIKTLSLNRRTACARAQFSGCSSTTNAHSETGQMAVCCQTLTLGALSSYSALSVLVGALFKKFFLFRTRLVFYSETGQNTQESLWDRALSLETPLQAITLKKYCYAYPCVRVCVCVCEFVHVCMK